MTYRTYVLRRGPGDEAFLETINAALGDLLHRHELYFHYAYSEESGPGVLVHVWLCSRPGNEIEVTDDLTLDTRYMTIEMQSEEVADAVEADLAQTLDFLSAAELKAQVRNNTADPASLIRLGLGSNDFDADAAELIREGLQSLDPAMRRAGAKAASLAGWSQLIPFLEACKESSDDERLTRLLTYALARCRSREAWPGQSEQEL
ncbi:MAG: hypothetical protein JXA74_06600 [Anaerolineae bacterium]|nr:hypothetical protein [Anaerolineae bacterium]